MLKSIVSFSLLYYICIIGFSHLVDSGGNDYETKNNNSNNRPSITKKSNNNKDKDNPLTNSASSSASRTKQPTSRLFTDRSKLNYQRNTHRQRSVPSSSSSSDQYSRTTSEPRRNRTIPSSTFFPDGIHNQGITPYQVWQWREETREALFHAYGAYMKYSYPYDELKPLSCKPRKYNERDRGNLDDSLGGFALTLIDSLDTLAMMGELPMFRCAISRIIHDVQVDRNHTVSLFETNIRILGGLLSAHLLSVDKKLGIWDHACIINKETNTRDCSQACRYNLSTSSSFSKHPSYSYQSHPLYDITCANVPCIPSYQGELLSMAYELGKRLLPAFNTPSGLPYHRINLYTGIPDSTSRETCTAAAGTYIVEFGLLSRLTGDPVFEGVALRAIGALWKQRSSVGLIGVSIDAIDGGWRSSHSGIGAGVDSWIEYLLKGGIVLDSDALISLYEEISHTVRKNLVFGNVHLEVSMSEGKYAPRSPHISSLQAFYPGLEVLAGEVTDARNHYRPLVALWARTGGVLPEDWDIQGENPGPYGRDAPLRPELIESGYHLYVATGDPAYILQAAAHLRALTNDSRVNCGYASVADVTRTGAPEGRTFRLDDRMDSYFIAETIKYLFLTFDHALWYWFNGPTYGTPSWKPCPVSVSNANNQDSVPHVYESPFRILYNDTDNSSSVCVNVPTVEEMSKDGNIAASSGSYLDEFGIPTYPSSSIASIRTDGNLYVNGGTEDDQHPSPSSFFESVLHYHTLLRQYYPSAHPLAYLRYDNSTFYADTIASLPLPHEKTLFTTEGHIILLDKWPSIVYSGVGSRKGTGNSTTPVTPVHPYIEHMSTNLYDTCPVFRLHDHASPISVHAQEFHDQVYTAIERTLLDRTNVSSSDDTTENGTIMEYSCSIRHLKGALAYVNRSLRASWMQLSSSVNSTNTIFCTDEPSLSMLPMDPHFTTMNLSPDRFGPSPIHLGIDEVEDWPSIHHSYPIRASKDLNIQLLAEAYTSEISPLIRNAYATALSNYQQHLQFQQQQQQQHQQATNQRAPSSPGANAAHHNIFSMDQFSFPDSGSLSDTLNRLIAQATAALQGMSGGSTNPVFSSIEDTTVTNVVDVPKSTSYTPDNTVISTPVSSSLSSSVISLELEAVPRTFSSSFTDIMDQYKKKFAVKGWSGMDNNVNRGLLEDLINSIDWVAELYDAIAIQCELSKAACAITTRMAETIPFYVVSVHYSSFNDEPDNGVEEQFFLHHMMSVREMRSQEYYSHRVQTGTQSIPAQEYIATELPGLKLYLAYGAHFGSMLTTAGLHNLLVGLAYPFTACTPDVVIRTGPDESSNETPSNQPFVAVVARGGCTFVEKARYVAAKGASAMIVVHFDGLILQGSMADDGSSRPGELGFPSLFIHHDYALTFLASLNVFNEQCQTHSCTAEELRQYFQLKQNPDLMNLRLRKDHKTWVCAHAYPQRPTVFPAFLDPDYLVNLRDDNHLLTTPFPPLPSTVPSAGVLIERLATVLLSYYHFHQQNNPLDGQFLSQLQNLKNDLFSDVTDPFHPWYRK